jgi:hypothetical protein
MLLKNVLVLALISLPGIVFGDDQNSPLQLVIAAPDGLIDGGKLQLTATVINTSDHDVVAAEIRGDPTIAYRFTVRDTQHMGVVVQGKSQIVDEAHPLLSRFSVSSITLKPGGRIQETIELDELYDLTKSKSYAIRAERYVPKELGQSHLISNEVLVGYSSRSVPKELGEPNTQTKYDVYIK